MSSLLYFDVDRLVSLFQTCTFGQLSGTMRGLSEMLDIMLPARAILSPMYHCLSIRCYVYSLFVGSIGSSPCPGCPRWPGCECSTVLKCEVSIRTVPLPCKPVCEGRQRAEALVALGIRHPLSPEVVVPHITPRRVYPDVVIPKLHKKQT